MDIKKEVEHEIKKVGIFKSRHQYLFALGVGTALAMFVLLIGLGTFSQRLQDSSLVYENTAGVENIPEGLLKVKKDADHPCAGGFEVKDEVDINGDAICTTTTEDTKEPSAEQKQIAAETQQLAQQAEFVSGDDLVNHLKETGEPMLIDGIKQKYQGITSAAAGPDPYWTSPFTPATPKCFGNGKDGRRIVIVLSGTKEAPITEADKAKAMTAVGQMEATLIWNSYRQNPNKVMHWRFYQGEDCKPLIITATQTDDYWNDPSLLTFTALKQDSGLMNTTRQVKGDGLIPHFLVFTRSGGTNCGQADYAPGGGLNSSAAYSFLYGKQTYEPNGTSSCWVPYVAQHEILHTIGAVDLSAPNTTLAGHCTDEYDLMCYSDTFGAATRRVCNDVGSWIGEYVMDCNANDYFSVKPDAAKVFNPSFWDTLAGKGFTRYNTANSGFMTDSPGLAELEEEMPSVADTEKPTSPSSISASNISASTISLSWSTSKDNVRVKEYIIKRNGKEVSRTSTLNYSDTKDLLPNTEYQYEVVAVDTSSNVSEPTSISVKTLEAGDNSTGSQSGSSSSNNTNVDTSFKIGRTLVYNWSNLRYDLQLGWQTPSSNVNNYIIKKNNNVVGDVKNNSFTDKWWAPTWLNTYTVTAMDSAQNEIVTGELKVRGNCFLAWCSLE